MNAGLGEPRAEAAAPAVTLADRIDALLTARFAAVSRVTNPDARRRGLQDLDEFAVFTVEGLIDASPTGATRSHLEADLRPVLARHQQDIAAALAALGERPAARAVFPFPDRSSSIATAP